MQKIDSKDHRILNHLIYNSRETFASIAKKEKIALSVVKYRVQRLKKKGIIRKFNTLIDYTKLGYSIYRFHFILQYVSPDMKTKIIEHFKSYKYTSDIYSTTGKYDLEVTILTNNSKKIFTFYEDTLRKYNRYLKEISISQLFEIFVNEKSKLIKYPKNNNLINYKKNDEKKNKKPKS